MICRARLIAAAGAGFLLAVLWMDLTFDVLALVGTADDDAIASIGSYYRRVTTDAHPMGLLVGAAMFVTVGATGWRVWRDRTRRSRHLVSLAAIIAPVTLALARTFPNAVLLGGGDGSSEERAGLARAIGLDHVLCFAIVLGFLVYQIAAPADDRPSV